MEKEQIVKRLMRDYEGSDIPKVTVNEETWTLADLFIRQWLNNGGNGFGMKRVEANYEFLRSIKEDLIKYNMINKDGFNNFGFVLWKDYNF